MLHDFRYACRLLRRNPAFSTTVVLTLAVGIGLTTAIFSVVDGVLLRPLPYRDPSALVTARGSSQSLVEWRSRTSALSDIAGYNRGFAPLLLVGDQTVRLRRGAMTVNLLSVLGVQPLIGRAFRPEDAMPGAEPVAILAFDAWQQHFGGRSDVVGQLEPFEPVPLRIVGILPPAFMPPVSGASAFREDRLFTPIPLTATRGSSVTLIGRLNQQATLARARAEELAILTSSAEAPRSGATAPQATASMLAEEMLGRSRRSLFLLFGASGLLLLIGCANVSNLLFAKSADGRRELAIRLALGAGQGRLLRLLLVQSCLLAIGGGVAGVLLAYWSFDALMVFVPTELPRASQIGIDLRSLAFASGVSAFTGLSLGVVPAWRLGRSGLHTTLSSQTRTTLPAERVRLVTLSAEVALAVVLLSAAGLFVNSLVRLLRVDLGFVARGVLTLEFRLPASRYPTEDHARRFLAAALERLQSVPGIHRVGGAEMLPVTRARRGGTVTMVDVPGALSVEIEPRIVAPGYFETLGVRLLRGRLISWTDSDRAPHVVVINDALARQLWGGQDPIGRRLRDERDRVTEVIGVVGDIRSFSVDTTAEPQIYIPHLQGDWTPSRLVIRTTGPPATFAAAVRAELNAIDPRVAIENLRPLDALVTTSIAMPRFRAAILGLFGACGLLLSAVGVAGVVAYAVSRRTREIGIRMALGARGRDIMRTVLGATLASVGIGLILGLGTAVGLARVVRTFLYEIEPHDPGTLTAVVLILGATAIAAVWVPARRAQRVDPIIALRAE